MKKLLLILSLMLLPVAAQAQVAFRAVGAIGSGTNVSSISVSAPAGVVSTDIVLVTISMTGNPTVTTPPGWNLAVRTDGTSQAGATYWALGSISFPASFSFSITQNAVAGVATAYSGVDNTTPLDVAAAGQYNSASSQTVTAPSITTINDGDLIVIAMQWWMSARQNPPSWSGYTYTTRTSGGIRGSTTNSAALEIGDEPQVTAGATGTNTATVGTGSTTTSQTIALRPAGLGGGGGTPTATPSRSMMGVGT